MDVWYNLVMLVGSTSLLRVLGAHKPSVGDIWRL